MEDKFKPVAKAVMDAKLVAFDECHKIYVAMDDRSAQGLEDNGYTVLRGSPETMLEAVVDWYENSCSLRFVQGVSHDERDPNLGFVDLISQFDDEDDDDYDDDEDCDEDEE